MDALRLGADVRVQSWTHATCCCDRIRAGSRPMDSAAVPTERTWQGWSGHDVACSSFLGSLNALIRRVHMLRFIVSALDTAHVVGFHCYVTCSAANKLSDQNCQFNMRFNYNW